MTISTKANVTKKDEIISVRESRERSVLQIGRFYDETKFINSVKAPMGTIE